MKRDKIKTQTRQCEYCEWVRSEPCILLNEVCINKKSPYYLKIVNTETINTCEAFEDL